MLRAPGAVTRPPSHSGSGLLSSGRSDDERRRDEARHDRQLQDAERDEACAARVVSRIAEVVEDEVHPQQQRDVPQVQRHRSGVADRGQPPHPRAPRPPGDRRRGGNRERAHHDCVAGQQQRRWCHVLQLLGLDADEAEFVWARPHEQKVHGEHRDTEQQRRASREKMPAVGDAEHAGDQPGHQVQVAEACGHVDVDPDGVDDRDERVGTRDGRDKAAGGGDARQQWHRGEHQHVRAEEPQQLNRDPRHRFVDVLGQEVAQYRQRGDPESQVVEHRPVQAGAAAHQPVAPTRPRVPTRRHTPRRPRRRTAA